MVARSRVFRGVWDSSLQFFSSAFFSQTVSAPRVREKRVEKRFQLHAFEEKGWSCERGAPQTLLHSGVCGAVLNTQVVLTSMYTELHLCLKLRTRRSLNSEEFEHAGMICWLDNARASFGFWCKKQCKLSADCYGSLWFPELHAR